MQDRPTCDELLAAIERFLDDLVPDLEGSHGFHARVAANAIRIVRRELGLEEEQLAREWSGLDELLGPAQAPEGRAALREAIAARNAELCERIRGGDADEGTHHDQVSEQVWQTVRDKLRVSNPELLSRSNSPDT